MSSILWEVVWQILELTKPHVFSVVEKWQFYKHDG